MSNEVDELLNGGCGNGCLPPPVTYEPARYVKFDECYQMRKLFKTTVGTEFERLNDRLDKRDEKFDKRDEKLYAKIDKIWEKQDSNNMKMTGLLISIIAGIIVALFIWALPSI